jgi:hypothetical protein
MAKADSKPVSEAIDDPTIKLPDRAEATASGPDPSVPLARNHRNEDLQALGLWLALGAALAYAVWAFCFAAGPF